MATDAEGPDTVDLWVGCYTDPGFGRGPGVQRFTLDRRRGQLLAQDCTPLRQASWLAWGAQRRTLYAVNESTDFDAQGSGAVQALALVEGGGLAALNTVASGGGLPAHLSVSPDGRFVFASNYGGGNTVVLPVLADGRLGDAVASVAHTLADGGRLGAVGLSAPAGAPPGSFALVDRDGPHAHHAELDPSGQFLVSLDLGLDLVLVHPFDPRTGQLGAARRHASSPGSGPRQLQFHPDGRWLLVLCEQSSTLALWSWDAAQGGLSLVREISLLPSGFEGSNFSSGLIWAPGHRGLYALNRLHDSIAHVDFDPSTGALAVRAWHWSRGSYPRHAAVDPSGRFLVLGNQRSDHLALFHVGADGELRFAERFAAVGTPAAVLFGT